MGDSDQGNPSRRQARQAYSNGHTATATTYKQAYSNGRTATATTYNDERNPRKAFVQCAILVAVVLLALTANAAAQEHRRHGGRHSPRPHHGHDPWCDHHHCGWANHSRSRHGKKWRHIGKKWRQSWG